MLTSTPSGESVTASSGLEIGDAYACVRVLAEAAASLPLIPYKRVNEGRERIERGPTPALLEQPAPAVTQSAFIGQAVAHLNTYGNAYIGKYRESGRIVQLGLLAPDRMKVELKRGQPVYSYLGPKGERHPDLTFRDVLHIKALTTDGLLGLSPVRQARIVLGLSGQLAEHSSTFFANDARPSGILKVKRFAGTDSQDVDKLKEEFNAEHKGTENAHKIAVLAGEWDFTPFSMPLDDAQFLEQRKLSAVEVARIFRVPPWMIGADSGESMTYSNTEQQSLQFVTYSLRPWLVAIEQAFSNDPDLFGVGEYVEFLLDALLRADSKTRAEVYKMALDPITGWMNRDEVRQRENLAPEPAQPPIPPMPQPSNGNGVPAGVT
jgi:HK97 family phage portal protein